MPEGRFASGHRLAAVLGVLALALPWLTPVANGPSPVVQPWLFAAACACVLGVLARDSAASPALAWAGAALSGWALVRSGIHLETLALVGSVAVMVLAAAFARASTQDARTRLIAAAWLLAAVLSTAIALAQYFDVAESLFGPLASRSDAAQAYANLRQRNQFATLTAIGISAACWAAAHAGRPPAWSWLAAGWLAIGNAATTSRTGLLELVVLLVLALAWSRGRASGPVRLVLFALAAYLAASWALPLLQESVLPGSSLRSIWARGAGGEGCSSRTVLWSNVLHLVAQKPWDGWGWGELDYAHYATLYDGPRFCDILDNAHNLPLHLAVELGVPAALAVVAVLLGAGWRARPWIATTRQQLGWSVLALIALHSLLEYPLWYGPFQLAAGAAVGLLATGAGSPRHRLSWTGLLALTLGLAVAYAAWDYRRVSQVFLPPQERRPAYRDDPVGQALHSWLFQPQAAFARLTLAPLDAANAQWTWEQSQALLHYSPEPRIIEKAIESATLLRQDRDALWHLARFKAAFPQAHARWARELRKGPPILPAR